MRKNVLKARSGHSSRAEGNLLWSFLSERHPASPGCPCTGLEELHPPGFPRQKGLLPPVRQSWQNSRYSQLPNDEGQAQLTSAPVPASQQHRPPEGGQGPRSRTRSQTLGRTGKPGSRKHCCLSAWSPGAQMLLSCHQSKGEERALQQGGAWCQLGQQHAQPDGCRGARRSPFLCPAPKAVPSRASEQSDAHGSPSWREAPATGKILGQVSGRLGHAQLSSPGCPAGNAHRRDC